MDLIRDELTDDLSVPVDDDIEGLADEPHLLDFGVNDAGSDDDSSGDGDSVGGSSITSCASIDGGHGAGPGPADVPLSMPRPRMQIALRVRELYCTSLRLLLLLSFGVYLRALARTTWNSCSDFCMHSSPTPVSQRTFPRSTRQP